MRVHFDCNIFDLLANDKTTRQRVATLIDAGALEVLLTRELWRQLEPRFGGAPEWFSVMYFVPAVAALGHHRKWGDGMVFRSSDSYSEHRGHSTAEGNVGDTILASAAHDHGAAFVSQDKRARKRFNDLQQEKRGMTYEEFCDILSSLEEQPVEDLPLSER